MGWQTLIRWLSWSTNDVRHLCLLRCGVSFPLFSECGHFSGPFAVIIASCLHTDCTFSGSKPVSLSLFVSLHDENQFFFGVEYTLFIFFFFSLGYQKQAWRVSIINFRNEGSFLTPAGTILTGKHPPSRIGFCSEGLVLTPFCSQLGRECTSNRAELKTNLYIH